MGIDAESHGRVTAFFIERKLKELRKIGLKRSQLSQEEPVADCLLGSNSIFASFITCSSAVQCFILCTLPEYCEGFIEVINTVEERIELESRLKVYEEMLANMRAEVSPYYLLLGLLGIFN